MKVKEKVTQIEILNFFLSKQYKLVQSNNHQNLIEKFINMDIFKSIRQKYSDIIEPPLKNFDSITDMPLQENLPKIKKLINQNSRIKFLLFILL